MEVSELSFDDEQIVQERLRTQPDTFEADLEEFDLDY